MLFDSTSRRELAGSFGGTLVVILTIVITIMLIRTIAQAAGGDVAPLSTECLAAQREIYREMRKMVLTPEFLTAVEHFAEFGSVVKTDKGEK